MKRSIFIMLFAASVLAASAQKIVPAIKTGTTISYALKLHDTQSGLALIVKKLNDTVVLTPSLRGLSGASYVITPAAFQNGDHLSFVQPPAKGDLVLPANQTLFCVISKAAFANLVKNHRLMYDKTTFDVKEDVMQNPLKLADGQLDVIHVAAQNEDEEMWILNNPDFPLICKMKNNPLGIDFTVNFIR